MSELRLVLLGVGLLVVAGVLGWGIVRRVGKDAPVIPARLRKLAENVRARVAGSSAPSAGTNPRRHHAEPALGDVPRQLASDGPGLMDVGDLGVLADAAETVSVRGPRNGHGEGHAREWAEDAAAPEKLLLVLTVMAPPGAPFEGKRLTSAFTGFDLEHGRMGLFHHFAGRQSDDAPPVFSVANVLEPGTFDVENLDRLKTEGICLFMQVPGPIDGPIAFDLMVDIGAKLARELGGQLRDSRRSSLTGQGIAQMREQVVEHSALASRRAAPPNPQRTLH